MRRARTILLLGLLAWLGCGTKTSPFQKIDGVWHYNQQPIPEAHAATFEALSDHYAKDRLRVYYGDTYRDGKEYFSIRHDRVRIVERADPATFRYIDRDYAKDAANVFFEGVRFPVSDIGSFELLEYGFARDRTAGYYHQVVVPGSDGSTFAGIDSHYSKDKARVFHSDIVTDGGTHRPEVKSISLAGARAASFVALEGGYAKDDARVYYRGELIPGADATTFAMLTSATGDADARDARGTFKLGRRIDAATPAAPPVR